MDKKRWMGRTSVLMSSLIIVYISMHLTLGDGERLIALSPKHIADISAIIAAKDTNAIECTDAKSKCDSLKRDKDKVIAKIASYVKVTLEDSLVSNFREDLKEFNTSEFVTVLSGSKIRLSSFFWLTGKLQYLEIIFWSLFGVLASLLYSGSEAMRTGNFNPKEIAVHIAKLFYAPLCTIIIILSINVLASDGDVSIDSFQYWLIVLSFILGFFSGRTIELLNKIKDLILPLGKAVALAEDIKLEITGTVALSPQLSGGKIDLTKTVVKIFSLNDPSISDILNPNADGSFSFSGLKKGDFVIKAEYKDADGVLEASKSITLNSDQVITLSLTKTYDK